MATPAVRRNVTTIVNAQSLAQAGRVSAQLLTSRELVAMREEICHPSQLTSPAAIANAIHQVLRHVAETTQSSRSLPVLGGTYWPNVSLPAGTAQPFAHGVGGIAAFIALRVRQQSAGPAPIIVEVGQDNNGRITLAATVACIADLWFFPQPGPGGVALGSSPPFLVPAAGGSLVWHSQVFTATGTFTATVTGTHLVTGWGGAGGGGGGHGGTAGITGVGGAGGAGAEESTFPVDLVATTGYGIVIGAGGVSGGAGLAGGQGGDGGDGGDSTMGALSERFMGAQGGQGGSSTGESNASQHGIPTKRSAQFGGLVLMVLAGWGGYGGGNTGVAAVGGGASTNGFSTGGAAGSASSGKGGGGGGGGPAGPGASGGAGGAASSAGGAGNNAAIANSGAGGGGGGGGGSGATTNGGAGGTGQNGQVTVRWLAPS
jgi:hypothetical protein